MAGRRHSLRVPPFAAIISKAAGRRTRFRSDLRPATSNDWRACDNDLDSIARAKTPGRTGTRIADPCAARCAVSECSRLALNHRQSQLRRLARLHPRLAAARAGLELAGVQAGVEPALCQQVGVRPALDDLALVDHQDLVGVANGAEPMGDHEA